MAGKGPTVSGVCNWDLRVVERAGADGSVLFDSVPDPGCTEWTATHVDAVLADVISPVADPGRPPEPLGHCSGYALCASTATLSGKRGSSRSRTTLGTSSTTSPRRNPRQERRLPLACTVK